MKYILGTAQLGLDYGINNAVGKPSTEDAFTILSAAYDGGIRLLDTANAYGDSEKLIGEFIKQSGRDFAICSKYSGKGSLAVELNATLKALSADKLYLYYLHKYEDCLDSSTIVSLNNFKDSGLVERIGVSVYMPDELLDIARNLQGFVDVVQIPFSIMDCFRWIEAIRLALENGISIFCRSVFLQGAIFKPLDDEFITAYVVEEHLAFVHELCEKYNCDVGALAFSFCECFSDSFSEISGILFGVDTLAQLNQNLLMIDNFVKIDDSDMGLIVDKMRNINPKFIDPRIW